MRRGSSSAPSGRARGAIIRRTDSTRQHEFEGAALAHARSLLRAAQHISPDHAAAEDLVQETLLRAWRLFDRFERGTNCKAWLFKIMLNLAANRKTRSRRQPLVFSLSEGENENWVRDAAAPPSAALLTSDSNVFAALELIGSEQRVALVLAVVEGFTCKEISAMLDLPIGTVMSRLARARASLREKLIELEQRPQSRRAAGASPSSGGMIQ